MKKCISTLACFVVFTFLAPLKGQTCTTFCLDHGDRPVFGRNYDWTVEDGLVIINKRGVTKASTLGRLAWTSKYGSATFNQYGREFPIGGMNEAGLVVESMVLLETEYPLPDTRPGRNAPRLPRFWARPSTSKRCRTPPIFPPSIARSWACFRATSPRYAKCSPRTTCW